MDKSDQVNEGGYNPISDLEHYMGSSLSQGQLSDWSLIEVSGSDAFTFLQAQLTQDLRKLNKLPSCHALLCARVSRKGQLESYFYISQNSRKDFIIFIASVWARPLIDSLSNFVITEEVQFELKQNRPYSFLMGQECFFLQKKLEGQDLHFIFAYFMGVPSIIFLEQTERLPEITGYSLDSISQLTPEVLERVRILNGYPSLKDLVAHSPFLTSLSIDRRAIDFNKGCFLGFETLSKLVSRKEQLYYPVLLKLKQKTKISNSSFLQQLATSSLLVEGNPAGKLIESCEWRGDFYLSVNLKREYRIYESVQNFKVSDESSDLQFTAQLIEFPLFKYEAETEGPHSLGHSLFNKALYLFNEQGRAEDAESLLRKVIELDPKMQDAHEMLGVILGKLNRYPEAISIMQELLKINPDSLMAHTNLSLFYAALGDTIKAEEHKAINIEKSFTQQGGAATIASSAADAKSTSRIEEMFQEILEIDPDDMVANFGLAKIYLEKKLFQKSKQLIDKVLTLDPEHTGAKTLREKYLQSVPGDP